MVPWKSFASTVKCFIQGVCLFSASSCRYSVVHSLVPFSTMLGVVKCYTYSPSHAFMTQLMSSDTMVFGEDGKRSLLHVWQWQLCSKARSLSKGKIKLNIEKSWMKMVEPLNTEQIIYSSPRNMQAFSVLHYILVRMFLINSKGNYNPARTPNSQERHGTEQGHCFLWRESDIITFNEI